MRKGIFISMEGPDGAGKTTQIELLRDWLEERDYEVILTREPGGTRISEDIRKIILNPEYREMDAMTELLLYTSARAQLVAEVIGPAIDSGKAVISDRFLDSTVVYQGIARGLGIDRVYEINSHAIGPYMPDVTFLLDLSAEEGLKRKKAQAELDRMEAEGLAFHRLVAEGYRALADRNPDRIKKLNAALPKEVICDMIRDRVKSCLEVI